MDALVEAEYEGLVSELAFQQDDIVSRTLSEAVRQAKKVSNSPRRRFHGQLIYQVFAHQNRSSTIYIIPTCFQEFQHLWPGDFGNTARNGPGMPLLRTPTYATAFRCPGGPYVDGKDGSIEEIGLVGIETHDCGPGP